MPDDKDKRMTTRQRQWRSFGLSLIALAATTLARGAPTQSTPLLGAGATFPGPLYSAWALAYRAQSGIEVRYDPVGSGLGVQRIEGGEVDFGASDAPLTAAQLRATHLLQFPAVIGGVLPVINISGVRPGEMKLTGAVLADIYLGRIRRWDDPAIAALNPGIHLPGTNITVVHREDPSGSSLLWTAYLSAHSEDWRAHVGAGITPAWPSGVGASGNEGVASYVQRTRFAIGYVEYYFARAHRLSDVALSNRSGAFVRARPDNFAAAVAASGWGGADPTQQLPTDAPGADSWPITGASFILVPQVARDLARERAVLRFFDWALHAGGRNVEQLDYTPLPQELVEQLPRMWQSIEDSGGRPVWP
jgi:phosphate transport system substrate-binding protein